MNQRKKPHKVIIIGAGPTGLTAGIELARKGVEVLIFDKKKAQSTLSRAVGINPLSLKLLKPSGVTKQLISAGFKLKKAHFFQGIKPLATLRLSAASPKRYGYNYMLGLPQDKTEKILVKTLRVLGGTVHYNMSLESITQTKTDVTAHMSDGRVFTADFLIGADGAHSATRAQLNIPMKSIDLNEVWSIADVNASNMNLNQTVALYLQPKGEMVFIAPIGKSRYRLVSNTKNAIKSLPIDLKITKKRREGQFNIVISQVESYQKGRVFLAGDAAHTHSPVGGRGMNLGIADAAELAHRMVKGNLEGYSMSRHKIGKQLIGGSEVLRKLLSTQNPISHMLVVQLFKIITKVPYFQKKFAHKFLYG